MNKETLIQNLRAKVGENDFAVLSQQSVDGIVTPLLPMFADDEKVTDATYELPVQLLKNYIGQYRHDVKAGINSEKDRLNGEKDAAIEAFKAQWEKEHGGNTVPDGAGTGAAAGDGGDGGKGGDGGDGDLEKRFDALFASKMTELTGEKGAIGEVKAMISNFISKFESDKKAERISAITKALEAHITSKEGGDLTHEQSRALHYALKDFSLEDDKASLDDLKKNFEQAYEATYKDLYPNGGMPFGNANGNGGDGNAAFEDFMKRRNEAAKTAAEEQESLKKKFV